MTGKQKTVQEGEGGNGPMDAGQRVRYLRECMGYMLEEFARILRLSQGYVCKIEKGQREMTRMFTAKVCNSFPVNQE